MDQDNLITYLVRPLYSPSPNHTLKINQTELSWGFQGFYLRMVEFLEYQNLFWNPNLHICHQYLFPKINKKENHFVKQKKKSSAPANACICCSVCQILVIQLETKKQLLTLLDYTIRTHSCSSLLGKFDYIY